MEGSVIGLQLKKEAKKMRENNNSVTSDGGGDRERVLELLSLFRTRCESISRNGVEVKRVDYRAMKELTNEGKIIKGLPPRIGHVPGVKIEDKFDYRVELVMVGLHRMHEHGIDHMWDGEKRVATCIVATEGHLDKLYNPNVLTYIGEGGKSRSGMTGVLIDQKLKGGNLALWNSLKVKKPVRVVKGFKKYVYDCFRKRMVHKIKYLYDGLYEVTDCEKKKGLQGNVVFEFKLLRYPGQPTVAYCKRT